MFPDHALVDVASVGDGIFASSAAPP